MCEQLKNSSTVLTLTSASSLPSCKMASPQTVDQVAKQGLAGFEAAMAKINKKTHAFMQLRWYACSKVCWQDMVATIVLLSCYSKHNRTQQIPFYKPMWVSHQLQCQQTRCVVACLYHAQLLTSMAIMPISTWLDNTIKHLAQETGGQIEQGSQPSSQEGGSASQV